MNSIELLMMPWKYSVIMYENLFEKGVKDSPFTHPSYLFSIKHILILKAPYFIYIYLLYVSKGFW